MYKILLDNGKKVILPIKNGVVEGQVTIIHTDQTSEVFNIKNDMINGKYQKFDKNGKLIKSLMYIDNDLIIKKL